MANAKEDLKQDSNDPAVVSLAKKDAQKMRSTCKYLATEKEHASCNDHVVRQQLQQQRETFIVQFDANKKEEQKVVNSLVVNQTMPLSAYIYMARRFNVFSGHASILLAQNENLEQDKAQLQQEKQSLLVQLQEYKLLVDGEQIEGMPNVPGGIKPKHKRRGSF